MQPLNVSYQEENGQECCSRESCSDPGSTAPEPDLQVQAGLEEACCGKPPGAPSSSRELPGYNICPYVKDFLTTAVGDVPVVYTKLSLRDKVGAILNRLGYRRNEYTVNPGLYAVGNPDGNSPVLVTANFKLSFDALRQELSGISAWILVLDTRGINVWCAAGKNLFSTEEIVRRVKLTQLDRIVGHDKLVLPQFGATGVSAHKVRKACGFSVVWGPIEASDLKDFISNNYVASKSQRRVSFDFKERLVLIPVEITHMLKPALLMIAVAFFISGIGPWVFSPGAAWERGIQMSTAIVCGTISGTVLVPLLLPVLPFKSFAAKGMLVGLPVGLAVALFYAGNTTFWEFGGLFLAATALSSFLGMNFTGSTPYTSPSGVEKEMRWAIPGQLLATLLVLVFWILSPFTG